jgi:hypothetical protein
MDTLEKFGALLRDLTQMLTAVGTLFLGWMGFKLKAGQKETNVKLDGVLAKSMEDKDHAEKRADIAESSIAATDKERDREKP